MVKLILFLASIASAQYCDLIGYGVYADDSGATRVGTFLGGISANTSAGISISNESGIYGSAFSSTSMFNQYSPYGSAFGQYSAFNEFASNPPLILAYHASTNNYTTIAVVSVSTIKANAVNPRELVGVLKHGNCGTCVPSFVHDTLRITLRDTVVKKDTLTIRDTLKVAVHDTVKYCPAAIRGSAFAPRYSSGMFVTASGRLLGACKE